MARGRTVERTWTSALVVQTPSVSATSPEHHEHRIADVFLGPRVAGGEGRIGGVLADVVDPEPGPHRRHDEVAERVRQAARLDDPAGFGVGEPRLAAAQEHRRVHRRDHRPAAGPEHPAGLAEEPVQVAEVLQHQPADDPVERSGRHRQRVVQVVDEEPDPLGPRLAAGLRQHPLGEVDGRHLGPGGGQP